MRQFLVLLFATAMGCGSKAPPAAPTPPPVSAAPTPPPAAPKPPPSAVAKPTPPPAANPTPPPRAAARLLSAEASLLSAGGGWYRRYVGNQGVFIQPEQFLLRPGGKYGWLRSAHAGVKTSPTNAGPGHFRMGKWMVEGNDLWLREETQSSGSCITKTRRTRRLPLGVCVQPAHKPCITIEGIPFYLDLRARVAATYKRLAPSPTASTCPPTKPGPPPASVFASDTEMIRVIIRFHRRDIKLCYDRQLLVDPTLHGKVLAKFTILPSGAVVNAQASGMDPKVATCVAGVIGNIRFDRPQTHGLVRVKYPFRFRSTP